MRLYEDVGTYDAIKPIWDEQIEVYNMKNKSMNLVLFRDALEHLVRLHRILRMKRGHALLVGVGGSGKQSMTKLAAFVAECVVFEITLSRGYGETEFREDLKTLFNMVGADNKKVVFLFTDGHVPSGEEGFVELINNILTAGMVPALFDDGGAISLGSCRVNDQTGLDDTKDACWACCGQMSRQPPCRAGHVASRISSFRTLQEFPWNGDQIHRLVHPVARGCIVPVATRFLGEEDLPDKQRTDLIEHAVMVRRCN